MRSDSESVGYVVVFPFLKTSRETSIAGLTLFPSGQLEIADETLKLEAEAVTACFRISSRYRIKNMAVGHIRERFDLVRYGFREGFHTEYAKALAARELLIYLYSSQHPTFLDTFLDISACDMFVLTREEHVIDPHASSENLISDSDLQGACEQGSQGYHGLLNGRVFFALPEGELVYPSRPSFGQNHYQDIYSDIRRIGSDSVYGFLRIEAKTLCAVESPRIINAIKWYNRSNDERKSVEEQALMLAVAFETLLGLGRQSGKTERFVESVQSILGRNERLAAWAEQFYASRSDIAHEGTSSQLHYNLSSKKGELRPYRHLSDYGRRVFQLILSAVISAEYHRKEVALDELFVANKERYQQIFQKLSTDSDQKAMIESITDLVTGLDEFKYVPETDLTYDEIVSALSKALEVSLGFWTPRDSEPYLQFINEKELDQKLLLLEAIHIAFKNEEMPGNEVHRVLRVLLDVTWHYSFMRVFQLRRKKGT
jgi:hypothetical protein